MVGGGEGVEVHGEKLGSVQRRDRPMLVRCACMCHYVCADQVKDNGQSPLEPQIELI